MIVAPFKDINYSKNESYFTLFLLASDAYQTYLSCS